MTWSSKNKNYGHPRCFADPVLIQGHNNSQRALRQTSSSECLICHTLYCIDVFINTWLDLLYKKLWSSKVLCWCTTVRIIGPRFTKTQIYSKETHCAFNGTQVHSISIMWPFRASCCYGNIWIWGKVSLVNSITGEVKVKLAYGILRCMLEYLGLFLYRHLHHLNMGPSFTSYSSGSELAKMNIVPRNFWKNIAASLMTKIFLHSVKKGRCSPKNGQKDLFCKFFWRKAGCNPLLIGFHKWLQYYYVLSSLQKSWHTRQRMWGGFSVIATQGTMGTWHCGRQGTFRQAFYCPCSTATTHGMFSLLCALSISVLTKVLLLFLEVTLMIPTQTMYPLHSARQKKKLDYRQKMLMSLLFYHNLQFVPIKSSA